MQILPDPIIFEWDEGNVNKNWVKHHISIQESEEVFVNKPLFINEDRIHSEKELRFQALGKTNNNRRLFISFTIRNERIRIISARDMHKKERIVYEQKAKTNT